MNPMWPMAAAIWILCGYVFYLTMPVSKPVLQPGAYLCFGGDPEKCAPGDPPKFEFYFVRNTAE